MRYIFVSVVVVSAMIVLQGGCAKKGAAGGDVTPPLPPVSNIPVEYWLTKGDQTVTLEKQGGTINFGSVSNSLPFVDVDSTSVFQTIDGFGYTLTGGSAQLINGMGAAKASLLQELFGNAATSIGVSYLRISIGASDLSASAYSYNDMPAGQTDPTLATFSLDKEQAAGTGLIPLLKEIIAINPSIKLMGSPWSAPVWMKDNGSTIGGSLQPQYYDVYAKYLVKYIQQMKAEGITLDAITIQNEPQHGGNNPSMVMSSDQQRDFVKNNLGPAFKAAGLTTKIIVWDHNCDNPTYPINILNDATAKSFVDGSAFHLYGGNISALSTVHSAHPDKNLYFTEQWTGATGTFNGDFRWHIKNVIIGSMRNWSKNALEWNLANDPSYGPHTPGGCTECKGALTISGSTFNRNVSYYIVGQASKFVPTGSVRINSTQTGDLSSAAFLTPDKKKVLLVLNDGAGNVNFNIRFNGKWAPVSLPGGSAATYIW